MTLNKKIEELWNKYSPEKEFGREMFNKTMKYQKKYNFKSDSDPKKATWNNEADAFKHTFMQAVLSMRYNETFSHILGDKHEIDGRRRGQDPGEENMDLWNNEIGRNIAKEIKNKIKGKERLYSKEQIEDMIAEQVMTRMKKGELITHPSDPRKYKTPSQKLSDEIKNKYHKMQEERKSKYPVFRNKSTQSTSTGTGKWVTINGNHVYIA
ncbi:MAG: hypothetical protein V8R83_07850 [Candidatus Gastranaerophilaceae bacterium]|jgi:hemolysin-type calcium-binding region:glycosyl hydrolase, BNR repeat:haemolysin-type calcium binding related